MVRHSACPSAGLAATPRRAVCLAIAGALTVIGGCSSRPIVVDATVFADASAKGVLTSEHAYPLKPGVSTFMVLEGDGVGVEMRVETRRGPSADQWVITRSLGTAEPFRIDTLRREADGTVLLLETISREDSMISRYDPPLILMPPALKPGEVREQSFTLILHPMNNPERVRDRGSATNRLEYVATTSIDAPIGKLSAARVDGVFEASLNLARVVNRTSIWFTPEYGMAAEQYDERARTLGITVSSRQWLMSLKSRENAR